MTWRARLAWAMAGISLAATTADTVILARAVGLLSAVAISEKSWPLIDAAAVGSSVVGALIVTRLPRHPIGWLLSAVGLVGAIALVGETYSVWVVEEGGPGPTSLGHAVGWVAALVGSPLILSMLAVMFMVAPDGRLLSPGWRVAVAASVTGSACFATALLLVPPTQFDFRGESQENSVDSGTVGTVLIICFLLLTVASLVAAAVSMVIRFRRAEGVLRQQLWCFALSACLLAFGVAWLLAVRGPIEDPADAWIATLPLAIAYFMLPILTGTAVLRYRLYNVDPIVNRAVLLAVGTAFAAAGYVTVVVAVSSLMGTPSNVWLSLLALAVVALAFQPMRRQLTRLADRAVYGSRAVPYDALSAFSRRLENTPDPAALLPAVAQAVGRAVSARSATARLQLAGTASIQATWSAAGGRAAPAASPSPVGEHSYVEVVDQSGALGTLSVDLAPGRRLRPHERRLLEDLGEQAALAFRNARLEAELAAHVAALDSQTEALEASRRRLFEAENVGRRRVEATITSDVLPHLEVLPAELERLQAETDPAVAGSVLGALVDRTTAALDQLRTLTRGIFPTTLARSGIGPALASHFAGAGDGASLHVDGSAADRRFPSRVETAAYFCCTRAADGGGTETVVDITLDSGDLVIDLRGLGSGRPDHQAMIDRVEAAGGSVSVAGHQQDRHVQVRLPGQPAD